MGNLYVFWQNALSIHQSAFLRNLGNSNKVILVTEIELSEMRKGHGYHVPNYGCVDVIISPNDEQIETLLELKNAFHIFTGVQAFKLPSRVFKIAVKKRLKIGVFSEPYNWLGLKGKLRYIKYKLFKLRYHKYIHFILTAGDRGRWCFEKAGFKDDIIYDWGYFTETPSVVLKEDGINSLSILFIGSIDERKNILSLVGVCKKIGLIDNLKIVGIGPLESELKELIKGTKCEYIGKVPNQEIQNVIINADVLILPSIFDGWGAVVNEALMCGTPVIASNRCGSSVLLKENRGRVFSIEENNLDKVLLDFATLLPYNTQERNAIREWAIENISGESVAKYFDQIMSHVENKKLAKPNAPWLSKN